MSAKLNWKKKYIFLKIYMKNTNSNNVRGSHALLRQSKKKMLLSTFINIQIYSNGFLPSRFYFFLTLLFGLKISGGDYFFLALFFLLRNLNNPYICVYGYLDGKRNHVLRRIIQLENWKKLFFLGFTLGFMELCVFGGEIMKFLG